MSRIDLNTALSIGLVAAGMLPSLALACKECDSHTELVATSAIATSSASTENTASLQRIEVTGRRAVDASTLTQPDLRTARERIERTAGGANVVDTADYRAGRVATLADALNHSPGVLVQPRFGAEETRLSIRGSGAQRTFHGRGIKLMQDGVPLNLADGSFDFQAVEALSARYVEVWRGANALQYGAANLGGAINFVSPNGLNSDLLNARAEAGSFAYQRAHLSAGNVSEPLDYYFAANLFKQDGFRRHAVQDSRRVFANLGYAISPQIETRFYIGYAESDSELPGSLSKGQLNSAPRQAAVVNVAQDWKRDIDWTRISNKTVWVIDHSQRLELFGFHSRKTLFHPIFQVIDQHNRDSGGELRYVLDSAIAGVKHRLVAGISAARGLTKEDRWLNVSGARGARTNQSEQDARSTEWYAESQLDLWSATTLSLGVQHIRASRRLYDKFIAGTSADRVSESFDLVYSGTNPKLGLLHRIAPGVQLFANISRSFEPPSFAELSGGLRPVLNRAQKATTVELGSRGSWGEFGWDAAVYRTDVTDELLQVATNVVGAPITVNVPRTVHQGLELAAQAQYVNGLFWRSSLLHNDFRLRKDQSFSGSRLPGLPRNLLNAEFGYRFANGLRVSVNAQSASSYAIDFANSFNADGYTIWGMKLAQSVGKQWAWFVEGRNLADKAYASTTGITRDARGLDQAQFLPGDGRAVYAGIELKFN